MNRDELTQKAKAAARAHGADLVGVVRVGDLPEHSESLSRILPQAQSVLVAAARHSRAALVSPNGQMAQFDTTHTYSEAARAAQAAARWLEGEGFAALAVPAFLPIDMQAPKKGMRGEVCWRRAGVRAGLGSYGENGLLVTREFGAAVRLCGLVTAVDLEPDAPLEEDLCDHCRRCVEACPAEALSGEGEINKRRCGETIFKYGFRYFQRFLAGLLAEPPAEAEEIIHGPGLRELWQTFMTGNYYSCFACQAQCPAAGSP